MARDGFDIDGFLPQYGQKDATKRAHLTGGGVQYSSFLEKVWKATAGGHRRSRDGVDNCRSRGGERHEGEAAGSE